MKVTAKNLIILLGFTFIIASCKQTAQTNTEAGDQELIEKSEMDESLKELANPLPQPFEVYPMLEEIGATYLSEVLNPVSNADNYFSAKSKAVSAGVYAADLGYAAGYNMRDDINIYSKTLKSLVDDLGVKIDYSVLLDSETKEMLEDKDSLLTFISGVYYDIYSFLYKESSPSLAALMAAGAWVEGLYIATHISEETHQNTDIVKVIFEQSESLGGLIEFLEKFKEDEMVGSMLNALKKLQVMFDETDGSLSKEQFDTITSTIETIRDSIIS